MSETWRRVIRTLVQVAGAAVVGLAGLVAANVITADDAAKVGAVLTFLTVIFTALQNALEERGTIPSLLKAPQRRPRKATNASKARL